MINEFEFIKEQYNIPAEILNKIENDIAGDKKNNIHLTALQKQAIGDSEFWCNDGENPNIVIQGATSSGKTLVAELLALQYVFAKNKHVVYLVPLKALVSEKVAQFKKDILNINENMKINIFASSSDYQDHDTELAEGQYDIAVVVYEKFFAMLAEQKDNKFLKKCGLIIVDEIQLLGSQDRGAKLEYAITKVNNNYSGKVRILGLTTVDCDVSYVTNWLNAKVISNPCRPIGLKEKIISLNGNYWEREVPGENANTTSILEDEHNEGRLLIEDIERMRNQKIDTKKNMLLFALLRDIYNRDPDKKIIVFASSRMRCRKIASEIAGSNVLEKQQVNISLNNELEKADDESEKNLFQNQLLPFGVAYHSAALPMSLRELIEYEFKKSDGSIKLIVATETLTIGMNLPADVMILYDNQVFRGNGEGAVDIRPQEYKNYIGRAGRLGITDKVGESYLFVNADTDIPFYWNKYVKCKIENISSALIKADERECAPYYLNLLCKGKEEKFTEKTIEELAHKTLKASEKELKGEILTLDTSKIIKDFKKVNLIDENKDDEDELDDEYEDDKEYYKYKLSKFGETLAPYALSVKTCFLIKKYFIDSEYKSKSGKKGNLPVVYTDNDLSENKYILDIIYTICKMNEVKKLSHPRLPDPVNPRARMIYQSMKRAIFNYLKQYKGTYGENAFWENSELEQIGIDIDSVDDDQVNNALRAILLFHWIKGELPSKIKENTGLKNTDFVLYTGDMARIGESCSYIVEAISKCFFLNNERMNGRLGALEHAFYSLSVKMKYGLANPNLIQVANRHVYGLTRSTIIKMDEDARNNGFDNINLFIRSNNEKVFKHLTRTQRKELIQQMSERYDDKNIENLISKVIEDEIVDFMMRSDFERIAKSKKQAECLDSLRNIFSALEGTQVIEIRM